MHPVPLQIRSPLTPRRLVNSDKQEPIRVTGYLTPLLIVGHFDHSGRRRISLELKFAPHLES